MEKRPTFGQWLKITWPDILTMAIIGVIAITRTFPLAVQVSTSDGSISPAVDQVIYPEFAYPDRGQFISSWVDTVISIATPAVCILLLQIRLRSFWDTNNAIMGLAYALLTSSAFQVTLKWTIGGFRPNFYHSLDICANPRLDEVRNSLQSFPSGHSTTTTSAAVYLFLYLNAKLKVFSNYHPCMWKLIVLVCPLLAAFLVCGTLTIDKSHNWWDIVIGAAIGTAHSFAAYRMVYASIFDWRVNHIPLNRNAPFPWFEGMQSWKRRDLVLTNRAGWRDGEDWFSAGSSLLETVLSTVPLFGLILARLVQHVDNAYYPSSKGAS
ncbi:acid phosphatase/Vanadium-dependent haloperoxidase [Camillea tinctor]|nr:acid phosphatase/Vanadium-dependent haloperoxidase [Camillea tinctor]